MIPGETHQLHIGTERLRAPELLFQPSMIGSVEAGIAEIIDFVLKRYPSETQARLVNNVFATGGPTKLSGFIDRLTRELREIRPFETSFKINTAENVSLDGWYGARNFGASSNLSEYLITRKEYEEQGGEYLKEHSASNFYHKSPEPLPFVQVPTSCEQTIIEDSMINIEIDENL